MKELSFFLLMLTLNSSGNLYSQKIDPPRPVTSDDFVFNKEKPLTILSSSTLVTYPFLELGFAVGAIDYNFKLKIESVVRLRFTLIDKNLQFLLVPKEYDTKPDIIYLKYYTIKNHEVISSKIKKSGIQITITESGYMLDLSSLINDSIAIIDLDYWIRPKSKEILVFYNHKDFECLSERIKLDIPEIYNYDISALNKCYSLNVTTRPEGGIVGYKSYSSATGIISANNMRYLKKNNPNESFQPMHYNLKSYLIESKQNCINVPNQNNTKIFNFTLKEIVQMTY
jgi:hypothetical protein